MKCLVSPSRSMRAAGGNQRLLICDGHGEGSPKAHRDGRDDMRQEQELPVLVLYELESMSFR